MSPKIGVGVSYYGGIDPLHRQGILECQESELPILWLTGGAYPEMNYAEIFRDALASDLDVLVIVAATTSFSLRSVHAAAEMLGEHEIMVVASAEQPFDFAALSRAALVRMAESETRTYSNTAVLDTGFSNDKSRPFASPWASRQDGSVLVDPLVPGRYLSPEEALIERLSRAGIPVVPLAIVEVSLRKPPLRWMRVHRGDAAERAAADIKHNYAFCVPTFGALDHVQQDSLWRLQKAGCVVLEYRNCPYIDQARSELKRVAIDELGCDGVFFIDHDIIFRPIDAIGMCEEAEKLQDVVSAVYCMRKTAHSLIGAPRVDLGASITYFEGGGLVPALYSGLGFSAIPKAVFESLDKVLPELYSTATDTTLRPYFALDVNGSFYSGEDASFCARVQGLAIKMFPGTANANGCDWDVKEAPERALTSHKVWVDTRVRIFHRGSYDYGIEDHSIAVPRYGSLETRAVATRGEVLRIQADNVSLQAQQRAIGVDPEATKEGGHSVLQDRGPCLNCTRSFSEHQLTKFSDKDGWFRACPEAKSDYVELIHEEHREKRQAASDKERES